MFKIFFFMVFISTNVFPWGGDPNIITQIRQLSNVLLNVDDSVSNLDYIFEYPIKDEDIVLSYNIIFKSNVTELNKEELSKYLYHTFNENKDYHILLSRIKYDSLLNNSEFCNLLYDRSYDTCNAMICINIMNNFVSIKFIYDNTSDLLPQHKKFKFRSKFECEEGNEEFIFEYINGKLKFREYNLAG